MTTAAQVIEWIEGNLEIPHGEGAGQPFKVLPHHRKFIRGMMREGVTTAALSQARGGGKSMLASALGIAALVGPLAPERGGQIVIVAASFAQGKRSIFDSIMAMMQPIMAARLEGSFRTADSMGRAEIEDKDTGNTLIVLGANAKTAQGLRPSYAILDEGGSWPYPGGDRLWSAIEQAQGKSPGSRIIAISTRPDEAGAAGWFGRLLESSDPSVYSQLHSPKAKDGVVPLTWHAVKAANPGLKYFPGLEKSLRQRLRRAQADDAEAAAFRCYALNAGTPADHAEAICTPQDWQACEVELLPPREGWYALGADLGEGTSWTAFSAYWPATGRLECVAFCGGDISIEERARQDHQDPVLYSRMVQAGHLIMTPLAVPDERECLAFVLARWGTDCRTMKADYYKRKRLEAAMQQVGFSPALQEWEGSTWKSGSESLDAFRTAIRLRKLRVQPNLVLRHAIRCAMVERYVGQTPRLRRGGRGRDDQIMAAVAAVSVGDQYYAAIPAQPVEPIVFTPTDIAHSMAQGAASWA